jgi:colanic acid/amylovoran biosynthesis protein
MPDWRRALGLAVGAFAALVLAGVHRLLPGAARYAARRASLDGLTALFDCDAVVMCGGGYLYSARRTVNLTLAHVALTSAVVRVAGRRMVMMPQSIGPLRRRLDRVLVRVAIGGVPVVVVRDAASARELASLRAARPVIVLPDVAFALAGGVDGGAGPRAHPDGGRRARYVVVCMDWTWARDVDERAMDRYLDRLADVASLLTRHGDVLATGMSSVASHDQDDFAVAAELSRRCAARGFTITAASMDTYAGTMATLRDATVVIGTRLHSCILAMAQGTPAIALGYQPKSRGTYDLLNLTDLCFDVETFDAVEVAALALDVAVHPERWVQRVRQETRVAAVRLRSSVAEMLASAA